MRAPRGEVGVMRVALAGLLGVAVAIGGCSRVRKPPGATGSETSAVEESGPPPESTGPDVELPDIRRAAEAGDLEAVKECLRGGVSPYGDGMWDPIHLAAREGHAEVVDLLVEHGVRYGPEIGLMLGRKDDVREFLESTRERERDGWERSLLTWAARSGRADMTTFLIEGGADVNAANPGEPAPLHEVCTAEVAQVLLDHGADANAVGAQERTPLHEAGTIEIARLLVDHGANVKAVDAEGQTPLHRARTVEIARLLIEHGADVNAARGPGVTPLMCAASAGRTECVKLLLEHGADPNARDLSEGLTALHRAVFEEDPAIARALLEHGAKVNATDNRGNTLLRLLTYPREGGTNGGPADEVLREYGGVECPHK